MEVPITFLVVEHAGACSMGQSSFFVKRLRQWIQVGFFLKVSDVSAMNEISTLSRVRGLVKMLELRVMRESVFHCWDIFGRDSNIEVLAHCPICLQDGGNLPL